MTVACKEYLMAWVERYLTLIAKSFLEVRNTSVLGNISYSGNISLLHGNHKLVAILSQIIWWSETQLCNTRWEDGELDFPLILVVISRAYITNSRCVIFGKQGRDYIGSQHCASHYPYWFLCSWHCRKGDGKSNHTKWIAKENSCPVLHAREHMLCEYKLEVFQLSFLQMRVGLK